MEMPESDVKRFLLLSQCKVPNYHEFHIKCFSLNFTIFKLHPPQISSLTNLKLCSAVEMGKSKEVVDIKKWKGKVSNVLHLKSCIHPRKIGHFTFIQRNHSGFM